MNLLMHHFRFSLVFAVTTLLTLPTIAAWQESMSDAPATEQEKQDDREIDPAKFVSALKFRNIGPAFMSGRIADIAVDQQNPNTWYVGAGSGNVWKTTNAGTTWNPIFDNYPVYSIGCITIDPSNSNTVWIGTGENNGGRHISFGDGVYVSHDGGKSFRNKGLPASEHISKINGAPSRFRCRLGRIAGSIVVAGRRAWSVQIDERRRFLDSRFVIRQ